MAPVLLCPDCGTKHPLTGVNGSAFACEGCGRTLKVPHQAQAAVASTPPAAADPPAPPPPVAAAPPPPPPPEPDPDPDLPWPVASSPAPPVAPEPLVAPGPPVATLPDATSTRVLPVTPPLEPVGLEPEPAVAAPRKSTRAFDPVPPRWIRFALWIVAVPLAFVLVFLFARLIGVLSSNQVEDVALDEGWIRFWPIARLMPFVALATAGFVHGGVYGLTRWRANRRASKQAP